MTTKNIITDKIQALKALRNDNCYPENLSTELLADREIILAIVEAGYSALEYASDQLKSDQELIDLANF